MSKRTFLFLKNLYCSISFSDTIPFVLSTLTSPVPTISPSGVSIIIPVESGIECVVPKNLIFIFDVIGMNSVFLSTTLRLSSGR